MEWNEFWTEVNDLNTARDRATTVGLETSALCFGGQPGDTINEEWNGTNWTETADLNNPTKFASGAGTSSDALSFGGLLPPGASSAFTEEWLL